MVTNYNFASKNSSRSHLKNFGMVAAQVSFLTLVPVLPCIFSPNNLRDTALEATAEHPEKLALFNNRIGSNRSYTINQYLISISTIINQSINYSSFSFDLERMSRMVEGEFISMPSDISKAIDIDAWLMSL